MKISKFVAGFLLAAFTALPGNSLARAQSEPVPPRPPSTTASRASARAQADAMKYAADPYLAYVLTSSALVNDTSRKGLEALAETLNKRTAIEPAGVVAIDIEQDDISLLPFIYWPVTEDSAPLSDQAQKKVQNYINTGGLIVFDINDSNLGMSNSTVLRRMLGSVEIKPLMPMEKDHTLTRTFYLVSSLPGSSDDSAVWVEEPGPKGSESVSTVIIGENNWAGGWAGTFLSPLSRDREMALRAGVNMVMYAIMGNYKSDQLQVPEILKRLGR